MMTLEEAIQANEQSEQSYRCRMHHLPDEEAKKVCLQIATNYHRQAEWLKELAERRKQPEIIRCKECKHKGTKNCVANAWTTIFGFGVKDDFYCGLAERKTDETD